MGSTFPKIFKAGNWSSELKLLLLGGKTKERLRVNCKAFFTWVGDSVGRPLGGDKAYRKLALKHHPDKIKRSMKVMLKVFIFLKLPFNFLEALNVQRACSRLFCSRENGPSDFWKP